MKFARIDIETIGFVNTNDKAHINFGDHLQNIIIKDLYDKMKISNEDIYVLNFNEISTYDGEYLILPINQAISHSLKTFISPKIIPVFLGISRDTSAIAIDELNYYKQYAPVGCRDQAVYNFLKKNNIDCYLNGCLTITLDKRKNVPTNGKVYIIEAPEYALSSMPARLKKEAVYLENTFYGTYSELVGNQNMEKIVRNRYKLLEETASLVVTSRMHIASPCIGMGIPVILVRESIDYRFSWIDKYIPIYTEKTADTINWNPQAIEMEEFKQVLINYAIQRIKKTFSKYYNMLQVSDFYEKRKTVIYDLPQFSKSVIDFIKKTWTKEETWTYAIWGENDASERLIQYLEENYPNAKYVAFYDSYKKIIYHGQEAQHPSNIKKDDGIFIFVTGYTATDAAKELFDTLGREKNSYYLFGKVIRNY